MIDQCSARSAPHQRVSHVTLAATADLVASATAAGTAVLAFNVITVEHAEGVAEGVERAGSAALLQISENTVALPRRPHRPAGGGVRADRRAVARPRSPSTSTTSRTSTLIAEAIDARRPDSASPRSWSTPRTCPTATTSSGRAPSPRTAHARRAVGRGRTRRDRRQGLDAHALGCPHRPRRGGRLRRGDRGGRPRRGGGQLARHDHPRRRTRPRPDPPSWRPPSRFPWCCTAPPGSPTTSFAWPSTRASGRSTSERHSTSPTPGRVRDALSTNPSATRPARATWPPDARPSPTPSRNCAASSTRRHRRRTGATAMSATIRLRCASNPLAETIARHKAGRARRRLLGVLGASHRGGGRHRAGRRRRQLRADRGDVQPGRPVRRLHRAAARRLPRPGARHRRRRRASRGSASSSAVTTSAPTAGSANPPSAAMAKAEVLIAAYVEAGYTKIHLDCSMSCADDPAVLADEVVAERSGPAAAGRRGRRAPHRHRRARSTSSAPRCPSPAAPTRRSTISPRRPPTGPGAPSPRTARVRRARPRRRLAARRRAGRATRRRVRSPQRHRLRPRRHRRTAHASSTPSPTWSSRRTPPITNGPHSCASSSRTTGRS